MTFYLDSQLSMYFNADRAFDELMALKGEGFRHQDGRLTQRVKIGDKHYFIKQHFGVGWREIFKNLLQLRLPILSAKNEWLALQRLTLLNVAVPHVMAYGERGLNPATRQSFILMEELTPAISLEDLGKTWGKKSPSFTLKKQLIDKVAFIARQMHEHGMNHRDFYICHFLQTNELDKLYLIDLHRAQIRAQTPKRWIIKDLAALYFSCNEINLTQRDFYRFIKKYRNQPLRDIFNQEAEFWNKVAWRGSTYRDRTK